jgi:O-antigen/teichoic acid export membrane protein
MAENTAGYQAQSDVGVLAKGATVSLIGKFAGALLAAALQIMLARLLGRSGYGQYAIGVTVMTMAGVIATVGLNNGAIRFGARFWPSDGPRLKDILAKSVGLSLLVGTALALVVFMAAPWLAESAFHDATLEPVIRLFAIAIPLFSAMRVGSAATRISQRTQYSVLIEDVGQPVAALALILGLFLLSRHLSAVVAGSVLSYAIGLGLAAYFVWLIFLRQNPGTRRKAVSTTELMSYSAVTVATSMFVTLINRTDRLLLGYFLSSADVGVYQAIVQASILFTTVLAAFNAIFSPMIADLYHRSDMRRLSRLFVLSTRWGVYICLPMFVVIALMPQDVIRIVFGPGFLAGSIPLVILSTAQLINVATGAVGFMLIMTGRQKPWLVISAVMAAGNILLNIVLIPRLGLVGAAWATAATTTGFFGLGLLEVRRSLGLWPYDSSYLKGLVAGLAAAGVVLLVRALGIDLTILRVVLAALGSALAFVLVLVVLGLEHEDIEFIALIRQRLGPPARNS